MTAATIFVVNGHCGSVKWIVRGFLHRADAETMKAACDARPASPDWAAPGRLPVGKPRHYDIEEVLVEPEP